MSSVESSVEAVLPPELCRALRKSLGGLGRIDPAWPERALAFLVLGRDEGLLRALADLDGAAACWLGEPGRLFSRFHDPDPDKTLLVDGAVRARRECYLRFAAMPEADPRLLVRLAYLFIAADQGKTLECASNGAGAMLQYLANDLVWGSLPQKSSAAEQAFDPFRLLAAVARLEQMAPERLLSLCFERQGLPERFMERNRPLLDSPALRDWMASHPQAVVRVLSTLSAAGRAKLAEVIGEAALIGHFGAQLLQLALAEEAVVHEVAERFLDRVEAGQRCQGLIEALADESAGVRQRAIVLLGRYPHPAAQAPLAALAAQVTKDKRLAALLAKTLEKVSEHAASAVPTLPPDSLALLGGQLDEAAWTVLRAARQRWRDTLAQEADQEAENEQRGLSRSQQARQQLWQYERFSDEGLADLLRCLNGDRAPPLEARALRTLAQVETAALFEVPGFGLLPLLRWLEALSRSTVLGWDAEPLLSWVQKVGAERLDLRLFAEAYRRLGWPLDDLARAALREPHKRLLKLLPPAAVWPFFAEYPQFLGRRLGLEDDEAPYDPEAQGQESTAAALLILSCFPRPPQIFLPVLLKLALVGKEQREMARTLLMRYPTLDSHLLACLKDSRHEFRSGAAEWLGERGDAVAVPALLAALKAEKRETVRAALLTGLERLGGDLSTWLSPEMLLAEAQQGLRGKLPVDLLDWFPFGQLPALSWQNGQTVAAEIPKWWVVLACKLKEPAANPLLTRYLALLDRESQMRLGRFVLDAFIAHDTKLPDPVETEAKARRLAPARLQTYQRWALSPGYEHYANFTLEQVIANLIAEENANYVGSAIGEKGILALVAAVPGAEAAAVLERFMRRHFRRRAQIEALFEAFGGCDDPVFLQLLLATARRHRTPTIQNKARQLAEQAALRHGWSAEQLADRTVPSAGFDDSGRQSLDYGRRQIELWLDDHLQIHLRLPDGKPLKTLPAAGRDDDAERVKEAKAQFNAAKKTLQQVLALQAQRLYEAMCGGRVWTVEQWREHLLQHPLLGRMARQLVWRYEAGGQTGTFRPSEDGSLIDVEDQAVLLSEGTVRLAHAVLLSETECAAWQQHLEDYCLRPPFEQLTHRLPEFAADARQFDQRLGWSSDAFTLRQRFEKRGYQRGAASDGGFFYTYRKPFAAGVVAVVRFSGNYLPENNCFAALETLYFEQAEPIALPLSEVPPMIVAEAWADYLDVAAVASFDPDWRSKLSW
ncbi:DUF4132 domain-containing protein [Chitinimonas lacunae]|uniref:DUF4132 domain-containing protein n=1 Tax=Chitinimonas lacunae TaxID=1963018 RepID=A0ABV8MUZ0_9NEIS